MRCYFNNNNKSLLFLTSSIVVAYEKITANCSCAIEKGNAQLRNIISISIKHIGSPWMKIRLCFWLYEAAESVLETKITLLGLIHAWAQWLYNSQERSVMKNRRRKKIWRGQQSNFRPHSPTEHKRTGIFQFYENADIRGRSHVEAFTLIKLYRYRFSVYF